MSDCYVENKHCGNCFWYLHSETAPKAYCWNKDNYVMNNDVCDKYVDKFSIFECFGLNIEKGND